MGGLPRSGNTLLSSILNQNPNISTTAPSIIADVYNRLHSLRFTEQYISFPDSNSLDNIFHRFLILIIRIGIRTILLIEEIRGELLVIWRC